MQFKHPELLYALLLLLIPIIVHLFQLRRFKQVDFTNVAFLKELTQQTRKSSQLKKWLTLLTRLALLACIVIAFAQPFTAKKNVLNKEKETVVYLDNSFSMQSKGSKGELFKRALQDLITNIPEDQEFSLFTNSETYRNTTISAIKNDLLKLDYVSNQLSYDAVQLKAKKLFNKQASLKDFVMLSDFQQTGSLFEKLEDSTIQTHLVQLQPQNTNNIYIDSAYISKADVNALQLDVVLKTIGEPTENVSVSLYNADDLIAKASTSVESNEKIQFSLPSNQAIDGRIAIQDNQLQFDNELFFTINSPEKIKVLAISEADDTFLKRIFTKDEFEFESSKIDQLNYSSIATQNIVLLNELTSIPSSLSEALSSFKNKGGYVLIIPSDKSNLDSYNQLLNKVNSVNFNTQVKQEKRITTINYSHPIYTNVFDKKISNFQYPKVASHFTFSEQTTPILAFDDGNPFLLKNSSVFIFSAPLNSVVTNFKNSPLIVPTLYNIAKQSLQLPSLYYTVGNSNSYDASTKVLEDNILKLTKDDISVIPQQQPFSSKVKITTLDEPSQAGIYNILNKNEVIKKVSYNYNRKESNLLYNNLTDVKSSFKANSISEVFDKLKSDSKINALWKWFVIFALIK